MSSHSPPPMSATDLVALIDRYLPQVPALRNALVAIVLLVTVAAFVGAFQLLAAGGLLPILIAVFALFLFAVLIILIWTIAVPDSGAAVRDRVKHAVLVLVVFGCIALLAVVLSANIRELWREAWFNSHYVAFASNLATRDQFIAAAPPRERTQNMLNILRELSRSQLSSIENDVKIVQPKSFLQALTIRENLVFDGEIDFSTAKHPGSLLLSAKTIKFNSGVTLYLGEHDLTLLAKDIEFGRDVRILAFARSEGQTTTTRGSDGRRSGNLTIYLFGSIMGEKPTIDLRGQDGSPGIDGEPNNIAPALSDKGPAKEGRSEKLNLATSNGLDELASFVSELERARGASGGPNYLQLLKSHLEYCKLKLTSVQPCNVLEVCREPAAFSAPGEPGQDAANGLPGGAAGESGNMKVIVPTQMGRVEQLFQFNKTAALHGAPGRPGNPGRGGLGQPAAKANGVCNAGDPGEPGPNGRVGRSGDERKEVVRPPSITTLFFEEVPVGMADLP